ncbi:G1/S-specific cyclin-E1 [Geodia barretti]|uniref:G1/S-specific cyclin-E1 n=2 Tax=Geodia barretti TaxID=519541 RepID=A0AA35RND3_GEOBA|nr:G1/S-specific cyclin-E1 [Geodia barretti]
MEVPTRRRTTTRVVLSRRRPRSTSEEQSRKKRHTGQAKKENVLALSLRHQQTSVKMQDVRIGLQRIPPTSLLVSAATTAKENVGSVAGKAWSSQQTSAAGQSSEGPAAEAASELMEVTPPASQLGEEEEGEGGGRETSGAGGPLPQLSWANPRELWTEMRAKDVCQTAPEEELQSRHPGILPTMRTILFDWLMEVCEEYKLHRETYYLTVDLHDRFLDSWREIQKEHLQAIGITCLFIASKIEEIYPPKVTEFAFVTDGACCVADILDMELLICKALNWRLNHYIVTVNTWANAYMQISSHRLRPPGVKTREFEYPAYSPLEFIRVIQLLDMCTLDLSSRTFGTSVLAASALYLASERSRQHFTAITGLLLEEVNDCVQWMYPFALVISRDGPVAQRAFPGVTPQDLHNIQTHSVTIAMLDDALELRHSQLSAAAVPGMVHPDCSVLLTPPRSERRCLAPINASSTY